MQWKKVHFNIQNIKTITDNSCLIKCPSKSNYAGYCFWHPSKLIRDGFHSYDMTISYTDDFTFKLLKYGNGKWNKFDIISEITISVEKFEEMFIPKKKNETVEEDNLAEKLQDTNI